MKKITTLILVLSLAVLAFAGCKKTDETSAPSAGGDVEITAKTIADLRKYEERGYSSGEGQFIYVFYVGEDIYRAFAKLDESTDEAIFNLPYDDNHDEALQKLTDPLQIVKIENIMSYKIPQDQLDALVGKTGEELFSNGWRYSGYSDDSGEFELENGPLSYRFVFDGKIDYSDDFAGEEELSKLKVVSARYEGVGDTTYIDPV